MKSELTFNRRDFLCLASLALLGQFTVCGGVISRRADMPDQKLRFGIATDPHYSDRKSAGTRFYRESLAKMREFVDCMNSEKGDFIVELGDLKDMDKTGSENTAMDYLLKIEREFKRFSGPSYHVLGNHDMDCISKGQFLANVQNTGIPPEKSFYSFSCSGLNFIVLDANFRSDGAHYDRGNFDWTDSNIPIHELDWLKKTLNSSKEPSIIFVHQQLDGGGDHCIKNASEVREILKSNRKTAVVFQGHNHAGAHSIIDGIHYYTLKAMVEGSGEENNSFALVEAGHDMSFKIFGFRRAESVK